jgi:glutathione S-transferase
MGKVPAVKYGDAVVTEQVAVYLYLADLFPKAQLAPAIEDPLRGPYLRWLAFYGSCFEPAIIDRSQKREPAPRAMSPYGEFDTMFKTLTDQLAAGPYLLGMRFLAVDVLWGALGWITHFGLIPAVPVIQSYVERGQRASCFVKAPRAMRSSRRPWPPTSCQTVRSSGEDALRLGGVRRDRIHQSRRQAVVGLETQLLETRADGSHLVGLGAGFDDGRDERGEFRRGPAAFLRKLRVHEVETVEQVRLVLDSAVHVHAAAAARVALDRRIRIDDLELLRIGADAQVVAADHRDLHEGRARRLPALRAATDVVVRRVALETDGDGRLRICTSACRRRGSRRPAAPFVDRQDEWIVRP